jgi:uncharacterized protein
MPRSEAIDALRRSEQALRARGVWHAALFPALRMTVFEYADLKEYICGLFDRPVDVVNREALKDYVRPAATADAIYAF